MTNLSRAIFIVVALSYLAFRQPPKIFHRGKIEEVSGCTEIKLFFSKEISSSNCTYPSVHLLFGLGFRDETKITVFGKGFNTEKVYGKTNRSIGYFVDSNSSIKIITLGNDSILTHHKLYFGIERDTFCLIFPKNYYEYNMLEVSQGDQGLWATFKSQETVLPVE